ncbi:hypothetical protein AVEN_58914-1 [Araneus ventricosus]|uniref:Uncharacterized protein n=1 Tax=Araneus ventricosus TaxID=182803 RepID=A0A4Y2ET79_ARAVE|nr:hypothetical protein AVEN_58914-1 [Araneus ventricosus]
MWFGRALEAASSFSDVEDRHLFHKTVAIDVQSHPETIFRKQDPLLQAKSIVDDIKKIYKAHHHQFLQPVFREEQIDSVMAVVCSQPLCDDPQNIPTPALRATCIYWPAAGLL